MPEKKKTTEVKSLKKLAAQNAPLLLLEAALFTFAAILIFMRPIQTLALLTLMFGIVLLVFGLYQLLFGFFGKENAPHEKTLSLVFGVINIVLGLIFFLQPVSSMVALVYLFAILFLVKAIRTIVIAVDMMRSKSGHYAIDIVVALIMATIAVLALLFPAFGALTAMYFIGVTLALYAAADIYLYMELVQVKKVTK